MAERLLELIEKYEGEIRNCKRNTENVFITAYEMDKMKLLIEQYESFIDDLNSLLYSSM